MAKTMTFKPVLAAGADPQAVAGINTALQAVVRSGAIDCIEISIDGQHIGNMIADEIVTPHGVYKTHLTASAKDSHTPHPVGHHHPASEYIYHLRAKP